MHFSWITQEAVPGSVASNTLDSLRIEVNGAPVHTFLTPFQSEEDVDVDAGAVLLASVSDYDSGYRVNRSVAYIMTGSEESIYVHPYDSGEGCFAVAQAQVVHEPEPEDPGVDDPDVSDDPVVDSEPTPEPSVQEPDPTDVEPEPENPSAADRQDDAPAISPSLAVLFIAAGAALVAVALRH